MPKRPRWTPNSRSDLDDHVEHITYEVRWLCTGHDVWREFDSPAERVGPFAESDVGNLGLETALIHCRVLLDFLLLRSSPWPGDVLACEYLPRWSGPQPQPVAPVPTVEARLGETMPYLRDALDGWLAHLGRTRLQAPRKPDWARVLAECRELVAVDWFNQLEPAWREPFREARDEAKPPR